MRKREYMIRNLFKFKKLMLIYLLLITIEVFSEDTVFLENNILMIHDEEMNLEKVDDDQNIYQYQLFLLCVIRLSCFLTNYLWHSKI